MNPLKNREEWDARRRARLEGLKQMLRDENEKGNSVAHAVPCATPGCFGVRVVSNHQLDEIADMASGALRCPWCEAHGNVPRQVWHWQKITPRAFREGAGATNPDRLPANVRDALLDALLGGDGASVYVHGATGAGKSRALFYALGKLSLRSPVRPRIIRGGDLRASFFRTYGSDDPSATARLIDDLVDEDLLIFDDFGQDELSATMLADLWRIIDTRTADARQTIFLSNYAPGALATRYARSVPAGADNALPSMIRRIRDFCAVVPARV